MSVTGRLLMGRPLISALFQYNSLWKSFPIYTRNEVKFSTCLNLRKKVTMSEEEWAKKLTEEQYYVTRQKGTEPPFTGRYYDEHGVGVYKCICCGSDLFSSKTKFDSGSGWPSFYDTLKDGGNSGNSNVNEHRDTSHGMVRTEVTCSQCDAHLGHVFNDGPKPTRLRYCINSASLNFIREK